MKTKGTGRPMKNDPCGQCTEQPTKRMGNATGGGTNPPRNQRRTIPHLKGKAFPGQWPSPTDKGTKRSSK